MLVFVNSPFILRLPAQIRQLQTRQNPPNWSWWFFRGFFSNFSHVLYVIRKNGYMFTSERSRGCSKWGRASSTSLYTTGLNRVKGTHHRQKTIGAFSWCWHFHGFRVLYPGDMDCNSYNFLHNRNIFLNMWMSTWWPEHSCLQHTALLPPQYTLHTEGWKYCATNSNSG